MEHPDCCCPCCCDCWYDDAPDLEVRKHTHPIAAGKSNLAGSIGGPVETLELHAWNPEDLTGLPYAEG